MMNRKAGSFFIGVLVLVVLIVALMKNRPSLSVVSIPQTPHEIYTETPSSPSDLPSRSPENTLSAAEGVRLEQASQVAGETLQEKIKNTKLIDVSQYRAEVKKNPHATPTKYIESSLKLGTLFDSVKTEKDASDVLQYYKDCLTSDAPPPLKVTCFNYSQRIAEGYPSLKNEFEPLYFSLDPEVRKVVDLTRSKR